MTTERTPDELRELLGAYALNALEPDERAQIDALLLADASARAELHELEHAAAWLGHASLRPPASAWDAIAAEVDRDLAAETPAAPPAESPAETPIPMPLRTRSAPRRVSRLLVAAAAVVVLAVGAAGVFAIAGRSSSSDSVTTQYEAARHDPSAREVTLRSADGRYSANALVVNGTGYLADASMPRLGPDRDFQLWSITPAGPVSVGLMRGDVDVRRFRVVGATTALAVTNEPRGGSRAPTGAPIISGALERA